MNIEIMRNTLYKAYLEDFYNFCQVLSRLPDLFFTFEISEPTYII